MNYLNPIQLAALPGEKMVKNNAGGFVYEISDKERLERFLILGSDWGTYYVSEKELTLKNAEFVIDYIKRDSHAVYLTLAEIAIEGRAPKYNTILFVYALLMKFGNKFTKKECYKGIKDICYTPTQLFQLLTYLKPLRGWSRGLRTGVANWYLSRDNDKLSYQLIKYRSRSGYTHKDVIRLCHPKVTDPIKHNIIKYAIGYATEIESLPQIAAFELLQGASKEQWVAPKLQIMLDLMINNRLTWEMIPTEQLNNPAVLDVLIDHMPPTALMRNLNRFAYNDMTKDYNIVTKRICDKLHDKEQLKLNKVHPINVVNSMLTYSTGKGDKGNKTWVPNQHILDALHDTYSLAMDTLEPTLKSILVGIDISGSMHSQVGNMQMQACQVASVLAHTISKTEPDCDIMCFDTEPKPYPFGKRSSLDEVLKHQFCGGGTDCGVPIGYAVLNKKPYDAIIILTDNETWAGNVHAKKALEIQRRQTGKQTKIVEICLVSEPYSQFPQDDKNVLRIVGFDASVITIMQEFIGRNT